MTFPGPYGNVQGSPTGAVVTDGNLPAYSGTSGKLIADSGVSAADADAVIDLFDVSTGFMRTEYDDVFPGGTWSTPLGATAPDAVTVTIEGIALRTLAFDGTGTVETMSNSFEIVHGVDCAALNAGTLKAEVHVHCSPSTADAGTCLWQVALLHRPMDGAPQALATAQIPITFSAGQYVHRIAGVEIDKPTAGFAIGDIIEFSVFRDGAASGDTYGHDMLFSQCALHMPFNSRGSRERYTK